MTTVSAIPDLPDAETPAGVPAATDDVRELLPVATAARTRAALRALVRPDRARALLGTGTPTRYSTTCGTTSWQTSVTAMRS
ncbi:hypothetical protein ACIREE_04425 [Streptomyces sp. NPDC102467]|uniref:hypothetical protein n=1 Tax=Streptomyces sp. NPDC102467 TaxID=3366179 RepID=UPI003813E09F